MRDNKIGFNKPDAKIMTYYAEYMIKTHKHLSGKFLNDAKKRIIKYISQLTKIANGGKK